MKKKLIKIFTITSQLLLVSIFLTFMFASKNLANNKVVIENTNLNKSSDIVNKMFLVQPVSLEKDNIEEKETEVTEELKVAPVEEQKEEKFEAPVVQQPTKEEPVNEPQRLASVDISKYKNYENVGFIVTTDNNTYELSDDDLNLLVAVVAAEAENSIDDTLGVISVILNRCEPTSSWSSYYEDGMNPITQITAKGQFSVYSSGAYSKYMPNGTKYGKEKYNMVKAVVIDGLKGVRNNTYLGFNAWYNESYSNNYVVEGGNRFR